MLDHATTRILQDIMAVKDQVSVGLIRNKPVLGLKNGQVLVETNDSFRCAV